VENRLQFKITINCNSELENFAPLREPSNSRQEGEGAVYRS
jgi:hypothetical protein